MNPMVLRAPKIEEIAAAARSYIEDGHTEDEVSVGTVMVIVELKRRGDDPSAPRGSSTDSGIVVYSDDARGWIRRALLHEAQEACQEVPFEFEPEGE